jgi:hypothetical protein
MNILRKLKGLLSFIYSYKYIYIKGRYDRVKTELDLITGCAARLTKWTKKHQQDKSL